MFCQAGNTIKASGGVEHWGVMPTQVGSEFSSHSCSSLELEYLFFWGAIERGRYSIALMFGTFIIKYFILDIFPHNIIKFAAELLWA